MKIDIGSLTFLKLSFDHDILPFDCGDSKEDLDLNDFLHNDAKPSQRDLLSVTYLIEHDGKSVAFFSVSNDKISYEDTDGFLSKRKFDKIFKARFPVSKQYRSFPAVKIGRLAIHRDVQRNGLGTFLLDYIKGLFITNNRTGCLYLTVDAYKKSIKFYEDNGFIPLTAEKDKDDSTRLMYFDLSQLR